MYPITPQPVEPEPNVDVDNLSNESDDEQLLDNDEQLHLGVPRTTVTRYGRTVRPPERYGYEMEVANLSLSLLNLSIDDS